MAEEITIEKLAVMVKEGFDETAGRFDQIDERFVRVDERFNYINEKFDRIDERFSRIDEKFDHIGARLGNIERDVSEIKNRFVYRIEFDDLAARVKYLESKLKIQSGK